jgi:hypothetical protein
MAWFQLTLRISSRLMWVAYGHSLLGRRWFLIPSRKKVHSTTLIYTYCMSFNPQPQNQLFNTTDYQNRPIYTPQRVLRWFSPMWPLHHLSLLSPLPWAHMSLRRRFLLLHNIPSPGCSQERLRRWRPQPSLSLGSLRPERLAESLTILSDSGGEEFHSPSFSFTSSRSRSHTPLLVDLDPNSRWRPMSMPCPWALGGRRGWWRDLPARASGCAVVLCTGG